MTFTAASSHCATTHEILPFAPPKVTLIELSFEQAFGKFDYPHGIRLS